MKKMEILDRGLEKLLVNCIWGNWACRKILTAPSVKQLNWKKKKIRVSLLLLLLSRFSRVWLCATPETAARQAPPSLGFSRQEHWSGLPFPSPVHESETWKWSRSVMSDSSQPHGLQPTRLLHPWDFPGKSTGVGCHCLLPSTPEWVLFLIFKKNLFLIVLDICGSQAFFIVVVRGHSVFAVRRLVIAVACPASEHRL